MKTLRIKLFAFHDDCSVFQKAVEDRILEEAHWIQGAGSVASPVRWGKKWYVKYYPAVAEAEDYLAAHGAILIPYHTDPTPVGQAVIDALPAGHNLTAASTGFQVALHMSTHLNASYRPTTY